MILTIFRHGEAGDASSDRLRVLTDTGEDDVSFGCHQYHNACKARGLPDPQRIMHSSWLRATQTADIIAAGFTHAQVMTADALQPDSRVAAVDSALESTTEEHVLLVSHQPLVSQLIDHYLGERGKVPPLLPGGLATLSLEVPAAGCGSLLFWAMPPEYEVGL